MKLAGIKVRFVINLNLIRLRDRIRRFVLWFLRVFAVRKSF